MSKLRNDDAQSRIQVKRIKPTSLEKIDSTLVSARTDFMLETLTPLFIWGGYGRGDPKPVLNRFYSATLPSEKKQLERFLQRVVNEIKDVVEDEPRRRFGHAPREFYSADAYSALIPSSTIKGSIRSRLEHLFKKTDNSVGCCYSVPKQFKTGRPSPHYISLYSPLERGSCKLTEEAKCVCVVCNIFGALGLASHVRFSDGIPDGNVMTENYMVHPSTTIEAVKAGSHFRFSMNCDNLKPEELGLIFKAMRLHEKKPILMGSYKYASKQIDKGSVKEQRFGEVTIKPLSMQTFRVESGRVVCQTEDVEGFVSKCLESADTKFGNELRPLDEVAMKK
jgi:hypothetical protein